jgi:hypothetical protein
MTPFATSGVEKTAGFPIDEWRSLDREAGDDDRPHPSFPGFLRKIDN